MPAAIEAMTPVRITDEPKIEISTSVNPTGPKIYAIFVPKAKKLPCIRAKPKINFTTKLKYSLILASNSIGMADLLDSKLTKNLKTAGKTK